MTRSSVQHAFEAQAITVHIFTLFVMEQLSAHLENAKFVSILIDDSGHKNTRLLSIVAC